jgi:transposase-like protein
MSSIAVKTPELQAMQALFTGSPLLEDLRQTTQRAARSAVQDILEQALQEELTAYLGFGPYERLEECKPAAQHRSGYFTRTLDTTFGRLEVLRVPKLRRGNGQRSWTILTRYQRMWQPLLDQAAHDYVLGLSLRDLQESLLGTLGAVLSLPAVNRVTETLQAKVAQARLLPLAEVPPVILVDGVWVSLLEAQDETYVDQAGHTRHVQEYQSAVILAAMGVWPDGRHQIIHFRLESLEDEASWERFWDELHAKGVTPETTWLIGIDGCSGVTPALNKWMPGVLIQRCTFHKIKNIQDNLEYNALVLPPGLPEAPARRLAREQRKQEILQEAGQIYDVFDEDIIRTRAEAWRQHWEAVEPTAVRRFFHQFELTLNFLKRDFPLPQLIHTNNLLERFFEEFRRKEREIGR